MRGKDCAPGRMIPTSPRGCADSFRERQDRKSTRLNSSHSQISYAVFCLKKKKSATTRSDAAAKQLNDTGVAEKERITTVNAHTNSHFILAVTIPDHVEAVDATTNIVHAT